MIDHPSLTEQIDAVEWAEANAREASGLACRSAIMSDFRREVETAINRCSMENGSDTPDFILAEYLIDCLAAFDKAMTRREQWSGRGEGSKVALSQYTQLQISNIEQLCRRLEAAAETLRTLEFGSAIAR